MTEAEKKKDDTVEAVTKLIKMTQEGQLKWNAATPRGSLETTDSFQVNFVFAATHKHRNLRLYGFRKKIEVPGPFGIFATSVPTILRQKERTYPYWEEGV